MNTYNLVRARATFLRGIEPMIDSGLDEYLDYLVDNKGMQGTDFIGLIKQVREEYCID